MYQAIKISETPFYQSFGEIKTDIKPKYTSKTQLANKKTKPFISSTVFYERYKGLNLLIYRELMNTKDFYSYISYVGEDNIGVKESDFEVYYPED